MFTKRCLLFKSISVLNDESIYFKWNIIEEAKRRVVSEPNLDLEQP